jgi:RecB family exonuclease
MLEVANGRVVYVPPVLPARRWPRKIADYLRALADAIAAPERFRRADRPALPGSPAMNDLGAVLSPSQAKTFAFDCSARWWFKYGMKLPDPKSGSLVRGLAVHTTVEAYYRLRQDTGAPVASEEMAAAYDEAWSQYEALASFHKDDDIAKLKAQGAALTRKYLDEAAPEIQPAEIEMPVAGEIGGVKVRGIIDLLDTKGRIIDLKTAAAKPSGMDPGYLFQLATYHTLAGARSSGQARLDTLVATKAPQLVTIEHRANAGDLMLAASLYPLVQEGMREGLYYPNRASRLCSRKYCNFADACCREYGGHVE